jgi:hypothetical protein
MEVLMQRFIDYGLILGVVVVLMLVFRLTRALLGRLLSAYSARHGEPDCDTVIRMGFHALLAGMLFLPLVTALLANFDGDRLTGGIYLHLFLVAISIIVFSFAEDLFGSMKKRPRPSSVPAAIHFRTAGPSLLVFWILGSLFLSPIFYTAMTLLLGGFYLFALAARPEISAS